MYASSRWWAPLTVNQPLRPWRFDSSRVHHIYQCVKLVDIKKEEWTKEFRSGYMKRLYREQRAAFFAILGGVCTQCGAVGEFVIDHIDPDKKAFGVGKYWGKRKLETVLAELKKCQLLCVPCNTEKTSHDLRTIALQQGITHGGIYAWMKAKCQCSICISAKREWYEERNRKRRVGPGYGPRF